MPKYRVRKFQKPKKRIIIPILKSGYFWLFVFFLFLLGGAFYFSFFTEYLKVKSVEISGNQKISSDEIRAVVEDELSSKLLGAVPKNIFLVNLKKINNDIVKKFPLAYEVNINRKLFNSITLNIEERIPIASLCSSNGCFNIDKQGVVFENGENKGFVIKKDQDIKIGEKIIDKDYLEGIMEIFKKVEGIKEIIISDREKIIVKMLEGWDAYFNGKENTIADQITNLKLVLEQKIPPEKRKNLEYIELRFGSKVYYRYLVNSENED